MAGDTCRQSPFHDKTAVVLKGFGGRKYVTDDLCVVTVTSVEHARWMLHVQMSYIMDCQVRVSVYDTHFLTDKSIPVLEFTCASRDPGVIRMNSSVVTVQLRHRNASDYSFNLVLTSRYWQARKPCPWFACSSGDCIPRSLMCDSVNNCFDNSDEATNGSAYCSDSWPFKGENWGVLASVLGAGVVLGVGAACCRHIRKRRDSLDELYDLNDGPYVHKYAYQYRVIRHPNVSHHDHHHHRNSHCSLPSSHRGSHSSHHSHHLNTHSHHALAKLSDNHAGIHKPSLHKEMDGNSIT